MVTKKNKNIGIVEHGRKRLLKINCEEKLSWWHDVLCKITLLANIFKDCLMLLHDEKIYVFTVTSVQLFTLLQATFLRKDVSLREIYTYYRQYGTAHTYAIFWTVKGDAKCIPDCSETKRFFAEILHEVGDVNDMGTLSVSLCGLLDETSKHKALVTDIKNNLKKVVPPRENSFDKVKVIPYVGNCYSQARFPEQVSPEQVSPEQDETRSVIVFSNGAALSPTENHGYNFGYRSTFENDLYLTDRVERSAVYSRPLVQAKYPAYVNYSERIRSYARWTHRKPDPVQLSQSGFFYTDQGDHVRCYHCGLELRDFSEDKDPLREHVRNSSHCPFLSEYIGQSEITRIQNQLQREQPRGTRQTRSLNYTYRHPEYQSFQSRLSSFGKWPRHLAQTPPQLAEAGLYYTGFEDQVRCFACDGGLKRWDPGDDPWTEHCRWFPSCPFARQQKGDDYIALVLASAEYENEGSATINRLETEEQRVQSLTNPMEQMTLRDPEFRAALDEHRDTCLEMGYQLADFNKAVQDLRIRGSIKPTIEELLDAIEIIKEKRRQAIEEEKKQNETPLEENHRLKSIVTCMLCERNNVNALFLPCAHHRLCIQCAEPLTQCPVCDRCIRQKIKTYMS